MASLDNSKRSIYKATYVPTRTPNGQQPHTARVVEKTAYIRTLSPKAHELAMLQNHAIVGQLLVPPGNASGAVVEQSSIPFLELTKKLVTDISPSSTQQNAPLLATVTGDQLTAFGRALVDLRKSVADTIRACVQEIISAYQRDHLPSTTMVVLSNPSFLDMAKWAYASQNSAFKDLYQIVLANADNPLIAQTLNPVNLVATTVNSLIQLATTTADTVDGFLNKFQTEQVGRLHLERLEMTPVGIEHGELVHSVPLTPTDF
jgi:hypothetical protein